MPDINAEGKQRLDFSLCRPEEFLSRTDDMNIQGAKASRSVHVSRLFPPYTTKHASVVSTYYGEAVQSKQLQV